MDNRVLLLIKIVRLASRLLYGRSIDDTDTFIDVDQLRHLVEQLANHYRDE